MFLLTLCFLAVTAVIFAAVMFSLKQSPEHTAMDRRLGRTLAAHKTVAVEPGSEDLAAKVDDTFRWIEEPLQKTRLLRGVKRLLVQAQSTQRAGGVLLWMVGAFLATALLLSLFLSAWPIVIAVAVAAGYAPLLILRWKAHRRLLAFEAVLPGSIEMCARSLRAGHSLVAAIGSVAEEGQEPAKTEFAEVFRKQNYGLPLRDALLQMLERAPSRDLQIVVTGMLVQKDIGGNLVEVMERIAAVIRDRMRIQGDVRTHTAQGRMTGWILCLLPPVLLLVINVMNPGYSRVLFQEGVGRKLLYLSLGLLIAGGLVIRQIVRGIEV